MSHWTSVMLVVFWITVIATLSWVVITEFRALRRSLRKRRALRAHHSNPPSTLGV